jgi:hypothetical protein
MSSQIRVDGTWRNISTIYVNVQGTWHQVSFAYVKVNGTWRSYYVSPQQDSISWTSTTVYTSSSVTMPITGPVPLTDVKVNSSSVSFNGYTFTAPSSPGTYDVVALDGETPIMEFSLIVNSPPPPYVPPYVPPYSGGGGGGGGGSVSPPTYVAPPTYVWQPSPNQPWPDYYYSGSAYGPPTAPNPGGYYCLDVDTKINTPDGYKRLGDLTFGDTVLSAHFEEINPNDPNANLIIDTWNTDKLTFKELVETTVVQMWSYRDTGRFVFNGRVKATSSQPFITKDINDGKYYYTRANNIVEGDLFFDSSLKDWIPVTNIEYDANYTFDVKIIQTSPYDMFFAEGILVHNK